MISVDMEKLRQAATKIFLQDVSPLLHAFLCCLSKSQVNKLKRSTEQGSFCYQPKQCTITKRLYQHRPQIAKANFCAINVEKFPPNHSTLQWHPAMAPRPLPQSWSSPPTIHYNPPSNGTTATPPKLVVTLPSPHHRTLEWHPAMAPRPLHPAMAPWCHVQSAKVVRCPPPLLEVRTPIAIAIWGKTQHYHRYVSFWSPIYVQCTVIGSPCRKTCFMTSCQWFCRMSTCHAASVQSHTFSQSQSIAAIAEQWKTWLFRLYGWIYYPLL